MLGASSSQKNVALAASTKGRGSSQTCSGEDFGPFAPLPKNLH